MEDCAAPLPDDLEHAHGAQAVGHLLREPPVDGRGRGELRRVERLGERRRKKLRRVGGAGDPVRRLDGDEAPARHDPAVPPVRPAGRVVAQLLLVREQDLDLELRPAEQRRDADESREDVLELPLARRPPGRQHLAVGREEDDAARHRDRRDEPHGVLACEQVELPSQRREPAGLDLDQQVVAHHVDDVASDRVLQLVAGPAVPLLQLRVERALVHQADGGCCVHGRVLLRRRAGTSIRGRRPSASARARRRPYAATGSGSGRTTTVLPDRLRAARLVARRAGELPDSVVHPAEQALVRGRAYALCIQRI
jgi:hypothetical protein